MSSNGSVSSRISQFGLYRTIDARTEEFLKLSKKRQIKQGCVCAAISTAVTVTVVVTVLLIYEYNVISEAKRNDRKTNWLSLMNNSAHDPNLLEILNKENINIDKTAMRLLPILLKALRQNRYIDKLLEEPTTSYMPYKNADTTATSITKNIFADTRNWMKTPQSRYYTVEYKTSPIVYFKNPTRNIEYFTKVRKIRDYQRILNYVDKMISERNYLGTTQPMRKYYDYTEKPYKMTTLRIHKPTQKVIEKQQTSAKYGVDEEKTECRCSHKLSEVMNSFLNSIYQLMWYVSGTISKETVPCNKSSPIETNSLTSLNEKSKLKNIYNTITKNHNIFEFKFSTTPPYKRFLNGHKYIIDNPSKSYDIRRDQTVNAIINSLSPSFKKHDETDISIETNEDFSTTNNYVASSDTNYIIRESNSKTNFKQSHKNNTKALTATFSTVPDYILQKRTYDVSANMRTSVSTLPSTDLSDEYDYAETTETTTVFANNFNRLDTYSLELVKSNLISKRKNKEKERKNVSNEHKLYQFKGTIPSQKLYNNTGSLRKMGRLVLKDKEKALFLPKQLLYTSTLYKNSKSKTNQSKSNKINLTRTLRPTEKITTINTRFNTKHTEAIGTNTTQNHTTNVTTEEKFEDSQDENLTKETNLRHIEEAIMILNNETTANQIENYNNILADAYQWATINVEENAISTKSMIPLGRTTYLEMQRNDWKHDENNDFDNEIVLLIYEYMIVVETNIVQNRSFKRNKTVTLNDHPIADRLDRSYFGFDQDYYERMPLLVNAMQENSYTDPSTEIFETTHKKRYYPDIRNIKLTTDNYRAIRRTSPRPFLYEYKNPIPAPFSKPHNKQHASRSWVESYRNAQRLKNLNEIIRDLERTINAKVGDLNRQTSTRIAFSGIYVEPFRDEHKELYQNDLIAQSSNRQVYKSNHKFDPLYTFKPDHPGEINLLAEGFKFAPAPMLQFVNEIVPTVPIFRPISKNTKNCFGHICNQAETSTGKLSNLSSHEKSELNDSSALKAFGVFLNVYPIQPKNSIDPSSSPQPTPTELDKIYFTTSRPRFQFKRKSSFPVRRTSMKNRPRFSSKVKYNKNNSSTTRVEPGFYDAESTTIPKMIVHVNVYSVKQEIEKNENNTEVLTSTTRTDPSTSTSSSSKTIIENYPILNSSHVEDYHVGSSGIINVEERTTQPPTLPIVTPIIPIYSMTDTNSEVLRTSSPEVIKFSPEDAKIPEEYLKLRNTNTEQLDVTEMPHFDEAVKNYKSSTESRTLIAKLKNSDTSSQEYSPDSTENYDEVTQTYVPQINGHYRNIHKSLSTLLKENSEKYRRKLEKTVPSIRKSTNVPVYVQINRNLTRSHLTDTID